MDVTEKQLAGLRAQPAGELRAVIGGGSAGSANDGERSCPATQVVAESGCRSGSPRTEPRGLREVGHGRPVLAHRPDAPGATRGMSRGMRTVSSRAAQDGPVRRGFESLPLAHGTGW